MQQYFMFLYTSISLHNSLQIFFFAVPAAVSKGYLKPEKHFISHKNCNAKTLGLHSEDMRTVAEKVAAFPVKSRLTEEGNHHL